MSNWIAFRICLLNLLTYQNKSIQSTLDLPIACDRRDGFLSFLKEFIGSETQNVSSKIWTRAPESISNNVFIRLRVSSLRCILFRIINVRKKKKTNKPIWFGYLWLYGISTIIGHLILDSFYTYIIKMINIFKWAWAHFFTQLNAFIYI